MDIKKALMITPPWSLHFKPVDKSSIAVNLNIEPVRFAEDSSSEMMFSLLIDFWNTKIKNTSRVHYEKIFLDCQTLLLAL